MKINSLYQPLSRGLLPLAALIIAIALFVAPKVQAASQTWTNAPVSGSWTNILNWNAQAVPGNINQTANNTGSSDIATFNAPIPLSGIGGASSPIAPDDATTGGRARGVKGITFDTTNCGAYVIASPSAPVAPSNGVLWVSLNGTIQINAPVTNTQTILEPMLVFLPSSTDGSYTLVNNSTNPSASLIISSIAEGNNLAHKVTYVLDGTNTANNIVTNLIEGTSTGGITKQSSGKWILAGANTFPVGSAMNINGGILEVQNASAFGLSSAITVTNSTLQIDGVTLAALSMNLKNNGTVRMNGAGTLNGVILGNDVGSSMTLATTSASDVSTVSAISGGALDGVVHIAGPGTVAFSSDDLLATNGTWSFDGGTGQLGSANSLGATPKNLAFGASSTGVLKLNGNSIVALSLASNPTAGTPSVQNINANPATLTVSNSTANTFAGTLADGAGGGALALTKVAAGTLTLSGANTYTGNTTVSAGTLNLTGSLVNSAVTVASGATLMGASSVGSSITVQNGGILNPGNNGVAGKLTTGSLTLNSGSAGSFEFDGTTNDQVVVTTSGGLALNGGAISLLQTNGNPFAAVGTYKLIQYSGAIGGTGVGSLSIGNPQAGYAYAFGVSGGYVTVTLTISGVNASWNVDANGNWSPGSWTGGTTPHAAGDSATLGVGSALRTVTLNVPETVGGLTFTNNNSFVVAGGNTLTLDNKGAGAPITVTAGTANAIQTPVLLNDKLTASVDSGKSLVVSGNISSAGTAQTLTVNGAGTTALSGNNSYGPAALTVGTVLTGGGILNVGNNSALSTGDVDVTGSSTLQAGAAGLSLANNFTIESLVNAAVDNNGNNLTLGGVIGGAGNLVKNGNGTLTLGGANTYAGSTAINGGVLSITSDGNLGAAPGGETANSIVLNGGNLLAASSVSLTTTRDIGIGLGAGSVGTNALISAASGQTLTVGSVIASAGNSGINGVTVNSGAGNSGTVILGGANTFNGPTYIAQGTLQLANSAALQNSVLDYTNGTLLFDGSVTAASIPEIVGTQPFALTNLSGAGVALTLGSDNGSQTYQGNFTDTGLTSGNGALGKTGTGTLTLAGTNSLTGNVSVGNGVLVIPTNGVTVSASVSVQGTSVVPQLQVNGGSLVSSNLTLSSSGSAGPGNVVINAGSASFSGAVNVNSFGSEVSVSDGITVNTNGSFYANSLTIGRGANIATAQPGAGTAGQGLIVSGGTVVITNNMSAGNVPGAQSGSSSMVSGGSLTIGGSLTFGCNNGGRWSIFDVSGGTVTVNDSVVGIQIGGIWTGAGQVLLVRGGTVNTPIITLGNVGYTGTNNTGSSVINLTGGALYLGSGGIVQVSSNATPVITLNGGVLGANADWTATNNIQLGGGTIQCADALGVAHTITLSGGIGGTNLVKTGSGKLILNSTGGNYYTNGTVISGGTLNINSIYALGGANYGGLTFNGTGGTLQYANPTLNNTLDMTTLGKPVTLSANATIDVNGNAVTNANGIGNGGSGGLTVNSTIPGGLLNLQGANTYTGNTTVNNGATLELGQATIPTSSTVTVNTGGVLQLDFAGANNVSAVSLGGTTYTAVGTYNHANHAPFITGPGSLVIASSIASYPTNITATVSGSTLTVAWPATHLGWELMVQTNPITVGLGNNWVTNYGTASVTSTNFTINPANGTVFYRLVHP